MKSKYLTNFVIFVLLPTLSWSQQQKSPQFSQSSSFQTLLQNDLVFEENKGQLVDENGRRNPSILYFMRSGGMIIFFRRDGVSYQWNYDQEISEDADMISEASGKRERILYDEDGGRKVILRHCFKTTMTWGNANPMVELVPSEATEGTVNYYLAHCPEGITDVRAFKRIHYKNLYPGIDVTYYTKNGKLKYDIIVRTGANLSGIKMLYDGLITMINDDGVIKISSPLGVLHEERPISFLTSGKKVNIDYEYNERERSVSFVSNHPSTFDEDLIIDPILTWSTYYGGSGNDQGRSTAVNTSGDVYMAGYTTSTTAIASGGVLNTLAGGTDAFLVKFNQRGSRLWATYYGGTGQDFARSIAVDKYDNLYLVGETSSTSSISSGGFQNTYGGGSYDAFLVKFSTSGAVHWATYYGGSSEDIAKTVALDALGNVYMAGETQSSSNIASGGQQNAIGGSTDAFVVKFSPAGSRQWATYLGGNGQDQAFGIGIDHASNDIYLTGSTNSSSGISSGGQQNSFGGIYDGFLTRYNSSGIMQWSTYYGGSAEDYGYTTFVTNGNVYVSGYTSSSSSIATPGLDTNFDGVYDGFMAKFSTSGSRIWGTYISNKINENLNVNSDERCYASCVSVDGQMFVALQLGLRVSITYRITAEGKIYRGEVFPDGSTYVSDQTIGLIPDDSPPSVTYIWSMAADAYNNLYVTGSTNSTQLKYSAPAGSYPMQDGALLDHQTSNGGGEDAFLAKIQYSKTAYLSTASFDVELTSTAFDGSGNMYVVGTTSDPVSSRVNVYQTTYGGGASDGYVTKYDSRGEFLWAAYYGGSGVDEIEDVATDGSGNLYVVGRTTSSASIASTGSHDNSYGGNYDAFVAKFNSSGVRQWATYYGGSGQERSLGIEIDASGNVYICGMTTSTSSIASGGHDNSHGGDDDAFLVKFNSSGVRQWATYYGGTNHDSGKGISIDASGNIFLTGQTLSSSSIATTGAYQSTLAGAGDSYVAKFNTSGVRQWATYYGGINNETNQGVKVDNSGNIYLIGETSSTSGIAYNGFQNSFAGSFDVFLVKMNSSGQRLWATYYGSSGDDYPSSQMGVDSDNNIYIAVSTSSTHNGSGMTYDNGFSILGQQEAYSVSGYDPLVVKFSGSGVRLGASYIEVDTGNKYGKAVSIGPNNQILFVTSGCLHKLGNFNSSPPVEPTSQPSNFTISNLTTSSFDVSYSPSVDLPPSYIAVRKIGSAPTSDPVDGVAYTVGQALGDGTIAYSGSNLSFNQTGLSQGTTYYYKVYAFNATTLNYLGSSPLTGNATTLIMASQPSAQPTSLTFTLVTDTKINFSFTGASGPPAGYLILEGLFGPPDTAPTDGGNYSIGQYIGSGKVVMIGSSTSVMNVGLYPGSDYYYAVYSYNGSGYTANYLTTSPLSGMATTTCSNPPCQLALTTEDNPVVQENYGNINIYPNPARDNLRVEITDGEFTQIKLINPVGETILSGETDKNLDLSVRGLSEGVYFMLLKSSKRAKVIKIKVER